MKAAFTKTRWFKITSILVVGTFLFQVNAFALSYEDRYAFDDWDDGVESGLIGIGMTFAAPFLPGGTGIVGGAIRGAIIGGINAGITGDNIGEGMLIGGGYGAAMGGFCEVIGGEEGLTGEDFIGSADFNPSVNPNFNKDYFKSIGNSMAASSAGQLAAKVAINEFGFNPEGAQFVGMTAGAFTSSYLSSLPGDSASLDNPNNAELLSGLDPAINYYEHGIGTDPYAADFEVSQPLANDDLGNESQWFIDAGGEWKMHTNDITAGSNNVSVNNFDYTQGDLAGNTGPTYDINNMGWTRNFDAADFEVPSPVQVSTGTEPFNWQDALLMSATQAGITVGVESMFEDKEWGPDAAQFAGEWGTKHIWSSPEVRANNERDFNLDLVRTGVMVGGMDAGLERSEALRIGNASKMLADNFLWKSEDGWDGGWKDYDNFYNKGIGEDPYANGCGDYDTNVEDEKVEQDNYKLFTGEKTGTLDKLIEPVVYMAVSTGLEELQEHSEMNPTMFRYAVATGSSALQAGVVAGSEAGKKAGIDFETEFNRRMEGAQWNLANVAGYDPEKFGNNSQDGNAVDELTSSNQQLWNFSGLSGLTHVADQIEEQGGDWRKQTTGRLSKDPFTSYESRAGMVYDNLSVGNAFQTTYAVSNAVIQPKADGIVDYRKEKMGMPDLSHDEAGNAFNSSVQDLNERISDSPGPVIVASGPLKNKDHEVIGEALWFDFGPMGSTSLQHIDKDDSWQVNQISSTEKEDIKEKSLTAFKPVPEASSHSGLYLSQTLAGTVDTKKDKFTDFKDNTIHYWNENTGRADPLSLINPDTEAFFGRRMGEQEFANAQEADKFSRPFESLNERIVENMIFEDPNPRSKIRVRSGERRLEFNLGGNVKSSFVRQGDKWYLREEFPTSVSNIVAISVDTFESVPEGSSHSGLYLSQNESGLKDIATKSVIKESRTIYEWNDDLQQKGGASLDLNIDFNINNGLPELPSVTPSILETGFNNSNSYLDSWRR